MRDLQELRVLISTASRYAGSKRLNLEQLFAPRQTTKLFDLQAL